MGIEDGNYTDEKVDSPPKSMGYQADGLPGSVVQTGMYAAGGFGPEGGDVGEASVDFGERNPSGWRFRDWPFALLFLLTVVLFSLYAAVSLTAFAAWGHLASDAEQVVDDLNATALLVVLCICGACAVSGVVVGLVFVALARVSAAVLVPACLVLNIVLVWAYAAFVFLFVSIIAGAIMLLFSLLYVFLYFVWRRRIPFAVAMLQTVVDVVSKYPLTILCALGAAMLNLAWSAVFLSAALLGSLYLMPNVYLSGVAFVLCFFVTFWVVQVLKNVVHVTVAGTVGMWYFQASESGAAPTNPTLGALMRATTTSFGSICLGSLVIAIIQTLRLVLNITRSNAARRGSSAVMIVIYILATIFVCLLNYIDMLFQYFNHWAFTHVAVYGSSYIQAAKQTFALLSTDGYEMIVNDNILGSVFMIASLSAGCVGAGTGFVLGVLLPAELGDSLAVPILLALLGFALAMASCIQILEVLDSAVSAIFVCFAERPDALRTLQPRLYSVLTETYSYCPFCQHRCH